MQQVSLSSVSTNWHTLTLALSGTQITVSYDTNQVISVTDAEATPYSSGGVSVDMWTGPTQYVMLVDNVVVNSLATGAIVAHALPAARPLIRSTVPVIQSIASCGDSVVISWSAVSGKSYRLQFAVGLEAAEWNDALPDVLATGPTAVATHAVGNSSQRFYRVLLIP